MTSETWAEIVVLFAKNWILQKKGRAKFVIDAGILLQLQFLQAMRRGAAPSTSNVRTTLQRHRLYSEDDIREAQTETKEAAKERAAADALEKRKKAVELAQRKDARAKKRAERMQAQAELAAKVASRKLERSARKAKKIQLATLKNNPDCAFCAKSSCSPERRWNVIYVTNIRYAGIVCARRKPLHTNVGRGTKSCANRKNHVFFKLPRTLRSQAEARKSGEPRMSCVLLKVEWSMMMHACPSPKRARSVS